ncbi:integrase family protein [Paraburkholderia hospita]|jgi:integrase|uniref:Integrase family protein n=1 Tax=Paraburkholderia hospita TaxID=169430 RepID=A0ABN0FNB3_9BURK|nr:integrase arm-type DNA-binding domain-containing protein [Paraburkholderia hospita]EIN00253.1 integrase family protein [Paraburkholderia hospita]OUL69889.1 integrase [Paraburkholderia hospita]OUL71320.1 integrase [Paraburkholderia hospita]SKC51578.1 Site-specific recombinase XerD [Paraburkholderia hospita]
MPKLATPLSESHIRTLQPRATRYSVADGNGLILEVMPTGKKVWRFRYTLNGRRQPMVTIGDYQLMSLRVARARAQKYAEIVGQGLSPVSIARQDRGAEKRVDVLRDGAELYVMSAMARKSDEYRRTTQRALDKDILPAIGHKPIAQVTTEDVQSICDAIKSRGAPQMALHTRNVARRLFAFLIARQLASINPADAIVARTIATQDGRSRVLTGSEIGRLLRTIHTSSIRRPLKLALHLLVLTMVNKSELIEAAWREFDLDAGVWTIPAARASNGRERRVFLSSQALAMLRELRDIRSSRNYVFPSTRGSEDRPIAKGTLNQAAKTLGLEGEHFVLHDFRRTGLSHLRDVLQSADGKSALAEAKDTVAAREMQLWADYVDAQVGEQASSQMGMR